MYDIDHNCTRTCDECQQKKTGTFYGGGGPDDRGDVISFCEDCILEQSHILLQHMKKGHLPEKIKEAFYAREERERKELLNDPDILYSS